MKYQLTVYSTLKGGFFDSHSRRKKEEGRRKKEKGKILQNN
ncbi:hypothetical protein [Okeania sp. KiyG1]|nr:hypothetical protein [Okeania sp. KiyG1]